MRPNNGFSLIELMIIVSIIGILSLTAMPFYKQYITRVRLTEMISNYSVIIRDIQVAIASGNVLSHEYTGDKVSSRAQPDFQQFVGFCYDDKTVARELHWNNKDKISKVTGVDAAYVKQFILLTYQYDTTGYCRNVPYIQDVEKLYSTVAFAPDLKALGITEIYKSPSGGNNSAYKGNEIVVLTVGGTVDYYNKQGTVEETTENLSLSCGIQSTAGQGKMNLLSGDVPLSCRYYSEWNAARKNRRLFPM